MNAPVIFGAGAIGGYLAAHAAAAGRRFRLFVRPARAVRLRAEGLATTDGAEVAGAALPVVTDPGALADASAVLLAIKSTGLEEAIETLRGTLAPGTPVISLLNGLRPSERLAEALPGHPVVPAMVPFNVAPRQGRLHRSSAGKIAIADVAEARPALELLAGTRCAPVPRADIREVQAGKLLLNLNNPVNALSGLPVKAQLRRRGYRLAYAAALEEALGAFEAAGLRHVQVAALPARRIVRVLRWPNFLFNTLALPRQGLDEDSQTSMAQDLAAGRPTEIDILNGDVVRRARATGVPAPVNAALVELIRDAEAGGRRQWSEAALLERLGLAR